MVALYSWNHPPCVLNDDDDDDCADESPPPVNAALKRRIKCLCAEGAF